MRKQRIHIIHQIFVWVFCFGILIQNGIEAPVICFESDGHINIEAGCNSICSIPVQQTDIHQDDCDDCFDIYFWNYNPDLSFLSHTDDFELDDVIFNYTISTIAPFQIPHFNNFHTGSFLYPNPPPEKTTILLI